MKLAEENLDNTEKFAEIERELNSRGIYHELRQPYDTSSSMKGYEVLPEEHRDIKFMFRYKRETRKILQDFFKSFENNNSQTSKSLLLKSKQALLSDNVVVFDSKPDTPHMKSVWLIMNCNVDKDDLSLLYSELLDQKEFFDRFSHITNRI